jgi:hypothetical protein
MRVAAVSLLLALLAAAPASAGPLEDFRRDGQINPCRYSDGQLRNQLNGLPPDVQQYAPGFADQLAAGREGCGGGRGAGTGGRDFEPVPAPAAVGGEGGGGASGGAASRARVPRPPAPTPGERERLADVASPPLSASPTGSDAPAWLLPLLLAMGAAGGLTALARTRGMGPGARARALGAAFEEAGDRTADALAGVRDLVRSPR